MITILFLAADPTDASRLRLGEELREIQEKLRLSKMRDEFELHQRMSVRPEDISQALLDLNPEIVHFSGHGIMSGALSFEDRTGRVHPIEPDALAALFAQFSRTVKCVILNACYSETQAKAISRHIDYVIGMSQAIGDSAAIAFAIGFYQALGGHRSIEDAYNLGCVQMRLQGISEHLTPLLKRKRGSSLDERKRALREQAGRLINPETKLSSTNYYYFYVSLDKLERIENPLILEAIPLDESVNTTLNETSMDFGRHEEYRKRCKQLNLLLNRLGTSQQIQNIGQTQMTTPQEGWAYAELKLRLRETRDSLLILEGKIGKYDVLLSCSETNFLDYEPNKGNISYTSTNHWFLDGSAEYSFRTHFWILSVETDRARILASPVYLALPIGVLSS